MTFHFCNDGVPCVVAVNVANKGYIDMRKSKYAKKYIPDDSMV